MNSEHDDLGPAPSADGRALYFYSDRPGGSGGYDVWVSRRSEGGWLQPENLGPGVNTEFNEYSPALTPDGGTLYFSSNRPRAGERVAGRAGWAATVRESAAPRHDYDLYAASVSGGQVSSAVPLTALNTQADEGCPAVSPFGDFLYFASDRAGGDKAVCERPRRGDASH